jgi:hypothetical protein
MLTYTVSCIESEQGTLNSGSVGLRMSTRISCFKSAIGNLKINIFYYQTTLITNVHKTLNRRKNLFSREPILAGTHS